MVKSLLKIVPKVFSNNVNKQYRNQNLTKGRELKIVYEN